MTQQRPSPNVHLRSADREDAESIASIYNGYVDAGGATFDANHWSPAYVAEQLKRDLPEAWFVAIDHDHRSLRGWSCVHQFSDRHGYRFSLESAIYLRPDSFGLGIGDALQQQLDTHCNSHGVHHLMAKIVADNDQSIAFHRRHGFEVVGTQLEVGNMTGEWIDVVIMQKIYR